MAEKKDCDTCLHKLEEIYNEPCKSCKASDVMYTNYQPDDDQDEIDDDAPDELDKEAQSLIKKFAIEQKRMNGGNITNMTLAKQCAIIHCDLMIDYINKIWLSDVRLSYYTTLKQKIEAL